MIASFRDADVERIFGGKRSKKLPPALNRGAFRKLSMLDAAISLRDLLAPPGNRLEKLSGNQEGYHSIRINDQWRVCFRWKGGNAHDVHVVDYH